MNNLSIFQIITFLMLSTVCLAQEKARPFYEDSQRGWFWRETPPETKVEEPKKKLETPPPAPVVASEPSEDEGSAKAILAKQREAWESARDNAVVNPTEENVLNYVKQTRAAWNQAAKFGDRFKKVIWRNPEFDPRVLKPTDQDSSIARYAINEEVTSQKLQRISKKYGLIYFFKGECPFCKRFSPILLKVTSENNMFVSSYTLDQKVIPGYENARDGLQMGTQMKVQQVPALFLVDPSSNRVVPVSFGLVSEDELEKKILAAEEEITNGKF